MNVDPKDKERGLYNKFNVTRTDGSSGPGGKHESCMYFVLDLAHDPHAMPALTAYANSCERDYPKLAWDLRDARDIFTPVHKVRGDTHSTWHPFTKRLVVIGLVFIAVDVILGLILLWSGAEIVHQVTR